MPGPTWPNRFFVHGGSSGGLDHSPTMAETGEWETGVPGGFAFEKGNIYDQLKKTGIPFRFYRGNRFITDDYPIVAALKGIVPSQSHDIKDFYTDMEKNYEAFFTFIEPSYGNIIKNTYAGGTSQHPMDDVRGGEQLIKDVYESIRKSSLWNTSLLIITWDEHGGFYDHVTPPTAVPPEDKVVTPQKTFLQKILSWIPFLSAKKNSVNKFGFNFNQYGVRVPAVIISPWIPKNTVDGTLYDHASIPATLRAFKSQLKSLTARMSTANDLTHLLSLNAPREDTPTELPSVDQHNIASTMPDQTEANVDHGSVPGFAYLALRNQLSKAPSTAERNKWRARYATVKTHSDLKNHYEAAKRGT
jgi:phospholipase C